MCIRDRINIAATGWSERKPGSTPHFPDLKLFTAAGSSISSPTLFPLSVGLILVYCTMSTYRTMFTGTTVELTVVSVETGSTPPGSRTVFNFSATPCGIYDSN